MKKTISIIIAILALCFGYAAATPYITISKIKTAVAEKDSEKLANHIDFPVFRENLKKQFNAAMSNKVPVELQNSPFGGIAARLATNVVDNLVESSITPGSLAKLMRGTKPSRSRSRMRNGSESERIETDEIFENARYSYDSIHQFSVWVPTDAGDEIRFILRRDGLNWKLVDMVVPI